MIELSESLQLAVQESPSVPVRLIDPSTKETFVLVRAEVFDHLVEDDVDYGPWTDEEMALLAAENANLLGWEGMEAYQDMDE